MRVNKQYVYLAGVFLLAYLVVWGVYALFLGGFKSPMYFLLPIPAFFLAYYIPDFFEVDSGLFSKNILPITFLVLSVLAFFMAVEIYFSNIAFLNSYSGSWPDFFDLFLHSAYLQVVLFGTIALAWRAIESRIIV